LSATAAEVLLLV